MRIDKERVKKASPIIVGLVIAGIGVLVGLGILTADVQEVTPVAEGESVEFVASENAIMVKADIDVTLEGTNVASGTAWILYGLEPVQVNQPDTPDTLATPITPPAE